MANNLRMFSTFNASDVTFSDVRKNAKGGKAVYLNSADGRKLMFQLPALRAPFGLSSFTDESSGRVTYSLPLSLDKPEVLEAFQALDERVVSWIAEHSADVMGKTMSKASLLESDVYKPLVKKASKEGYAPTINLKFLTNPKDGSITTKFYNSSRESVDQDAIERGQSLNAIIEINQIWRTPAGVGVQVRVHQVMLAPTNKLPDCAFLAAADEPVSDEEPQSDAASDTASEE